VLLAAALLIPAFGMLLASSPADARGGHHHGHRHSHTHFGLSFAFPGPFFYPAPAYYYPYPRYYYPQPVYIPPPQYIEQNPPAQPAPPASAAPNQSGSTSGYYWYYCQDSQTYYPYVQTCASQWQQVVPNSGPPS
jgi:hypothetical protein